MTRPRVGLVVNPVAGLGGRVGLGGTDGPDRPRRALELGAVPRASARAEESLAEIRARGCAPVIVTAPGAMGEEAARGAGLDVETVPAPRSGVPGPLGTTAEDTVAAVRAVVAAGVGLLLFAGGDGTARDVARALDGAPCVVLGVPTGVKMHSAVFAVGPRAAGEVAAARLGGAAPGVRDAEVMDRDEEALRAGRTASRLYGWLTVPDVPARVQQRKTGSASAAYDTSGGIAAELAGRAGDGLLVLGPGTTTRAVAAALGADASLVGVDVLDLRGGQAVVAAKDASEAEILARLDPARPCHVVVSPIGGQGFLLGRGNQQISPRVLRAAGGRGGLLVVCAEGKLAALQGRPLLVDTGDRALDAELTGHVRVITGHRRISLYRTEA
ncbi:ATP-NAD kinase family protein [Streptomyces sp. NPDC059524]|uniref:ATP-NAD kinase family protein n=1 Tax=Streptomyces sp. NPDC059524 TaxID=3346856 RepID=UPI003698D816